MVVTAECNSPVADMRRQTHHRAKICRAKAPTKKKKDSSSDDDSSSEDDSSSNEEGKEEDVTHFFGVVMYATSHMYPNAEGSLFSDPSTFIDY